MALIELSRWLVASSVLVRLTGALAAPASESSDTVQRGVSRVFTRCGTARNPRWAWLPGRRAMPVSVAPVGLTETGAGVSFCHLLEHKVLQPSLVDGQCLTARCGQLNGK